MDADPQDNIDPLALTDEQLRIATTAARARANRLLEASRRAGPQQWSDVARASNRAVAEYLALDNEARAREAIRVAAPAEPELLPGEHDPLPSWVLWLLVLAGAVVAFVLITRTAA